MARCVKLLLLLVSTMCFAQSPVTPNLHLNLPSRDTRNWDQLLNQNFEILDGALSGTGPSPVTSNPSNGGIVVDDTYDFDVAPTTPPTLVAGSNTVTFATCPKGVNSTDTMALLNPHYLWIKPAAGDTAPGEPVFILGGAGLSESINCTISFNSAFAHTTGYHITSATSGIQEGIQKSGVNPGSLIELVARKTYTCKAPIFFSRSDTRLVGNYAIINHASFDSCVVLGARPSFGASSGNQNADISGIRFNPTRIPWVVTPTGSISGSNPTETITIPTCPGGFYAAIPNQVLWIAGTASGLPTTPYGYGEFVTTTGVGTCTPGATNGTVQIAALPFVNTNLSPHDNGYSLSSEVTPYIEDALTLNGHIHDSRWTSGPVGGEFAGFGIMTDNDQAAHYHDLNMDAGFWIRKDSSFQGAAIFSPGAFSSNAAVAALGPNLNISNAASCVRWYDGNDITFFGNICQNYTSGAVVVGTKRGGFGRFHIGPNNHMENGATTPPLGALVGNPCIMVLSSSKSVTAIDNDCEGNPFVGNNGSPWPTFADNGGTSQYYYLVGHNNTLTGCTSGGDCVTPPVLIGKATISDPSANNVSVTWYGWGSGILVSPSGNPSSYDLLAVSQSAGYPYPPTVAANVAVATGVSPATACNIHNLCTIVDNVAPGSRTSYTPVYLRTSNKRYLPITQILPGVVSLSGNNSANATTAISSYRGTPVCINSVEAFGSLAVASMFGSNPPLQQGEQASDICPPIIAPVQSQATSRRCFSAAGTCGTSSFGSVTIAAAATTVTVTTTAVKLGSQPIITEDTTLNPLLGAGCNSTAGRTYSVTAIVPGVSFTITASAAPVTTAACLNYQLN